MSFFNFRANPDRKLLQHPLLKGKKLLGKGGMGGTFECDATSVYKVTCDVAQYRFLEEVEPHWFFPRCIEGHGRIAEDVYLLRCERLTPCIRPALGQVNFRIRQAIGMREDILTAVRGYRPMNFQGPNPEEPWAYEAGFLKEIASQTEFGSICEALLSLSAFVTRTGYRLDCHRGNFLMRGEQLVFNDPVSQIFRCYQPDANDDFIHAVCADVSA